MMKASIDASFCIFCHSTKKNRLKVHPRMIMCKLFPYSLPVRIFFAYYSPLYHGWNFDETIVETKLLKLGKEVQNQIFVPDCLESNWISSINVHWYTLMGHKIVYLYQKSVSASSLMEKQGFQTFSTDRLKCCFVFYGNKPDFWFSTNLHNS